MQAVRNAGSRFLRSWTWPQTAGRVVARTPAGTICTGARQLQDAAAKQKVEQNAAPSHTKFSTQIQVVSASNEPLAFASCGTEGFRNAKKGTGIAAQTAGIAAAARAKQKGVIHIRVVVKGLGPGRLSAMHGLIMGGLEVISITDNTPIPHNGCRPRKARKL
ncbi:mitochondrial ribosomal protein S11 [Homo sapiens]|uniref:Isoform 3 of Small ribosomal subunit protein uS11m n=1 Tax=Homo sapiens TaxID=9606 RepID=P82912-3|nr:small ribosomal subunit protein uS11m isoform b [Homo sapiens]EAX02001.1 mitochondrial ribosomal protein S11, isoform CRA_c [Homo sapiens]KAI4059325.1 mitochondrial ribosomal protein S11 [Homo sapiens]|eukprot:NP_789775.1 28S ribosomal protein S11, mitochondrial isoform b [Homo sapiens]